jgi:hypothetical protein
LKGNLVTDDLAVPDCEDFYQLHIDGFARRAGLDPAQFALWQTIATTS